MRLWGGTESYKGRNNDRIRLDRTPSTLDRAYTIARKVTLLRVALPESYEEKCTQLRARGFAVIGLIALVAVATTMEALLLVHQAGELLSLLALVLMEASFYWFYYKRHYELLNQRPEIQEPSSLEAMRLFERFLRMKKELPDSIDIERYLSVWFRGAKFADIKRGNVEELMAYGFWYKSREQMEAKGLGDVPSQMVDSIEKEWGITFPEGYNPDLRFMSHLWEDLHAVYRPLTFYAVTELLALCTKLVLWGFGFKQCSMGGFPYYTFGFGGSGCSSPGSSTLMMGGPVSPSPSVADQAATPILFLHGVGGLPLYVDLIKCVAALGNPVIAIEYKHIAMRLSTTIPTVNEITQVVVDVLDLHSVHQACVVAHSFGTFVASRLCKEHRGRLSSLVLIDPVCFGMMMPHLLNNFIYRAPRLHRLDIVWRDLMLYFASTDVQVSASFARKFYWSELNLWPDELPSNTCVMLSGDDDLVHAREIKVLLERSGNVKVLYNPTAFHGAFLIDQRAQRRLLGELNSMMDRGRRQIKAAVERTATLIRDWTPAAVKPAADAVASTVRRNLTDINEYMQHSSSTRGSTQVRQAGPTLPSMLESTPSRGSHASSEYASGSDSGIHVERAMTWAPGDRSAPAAAIAAAAALDGGTLVPADQQPMQHKRFQSDVSHSLEKAESDGSDEMHMLLVAELREQMLVAQRQHQQLAQEVREKKQDLQQDLQQNLQQHLQQGGQQGGQQAEITEQPRQQGEAGHQGPGAELPSKRPVQ